MLSNFDLEELATNYGIELNAIVMKDELARIKPRNGNYFVNLQSSDEGSGTHWVCLIVRNKNCFYCDSFGMPPPTDVIDFCKKIPKSTLGFSIENIQNIETETCGWYGLGLLIFIKRYKIPNIYMASSDYLKMFNEDTLDNNKILIKYFKSVSRFTKKNDILKILYKQK